MKFFFSIIIGLILTNTSWAKSASDFINSLTNEASTVLSSKLSDDEKIIKLKEIGENTVDIEGVGLYTLGKHRKTLTDSQRTIQRTLKLFSKKFLDIQLNLLMQNNSLIMERD